MTYVSRPFRGPADLPAMAELIRLNPADHHRIDHPYRLCSPALYEDGNARLWEDSDGRLLGFGIVQRQFWVFDFYTHPAASELGGAILAWAAERLAELGRERTDGQYFTFDARADDLARIDLFERHGLQPDDWHYWMLAQPLGDPPPAPDLPEGFSIRPLATSEAAAYAELHRAAFGTTNMTAAWRERTLLLPEYCQDVDLVAVAPDGRLAAFCIWWLGPAAAGVAREAQIEPLGTHPDFRQLGLGRALIQEGLRRLHRHGVATARVMVDGANDPGRGLYEAAGFSYQRTIRKFSAIFGA